MAPPLGYISYLPVWGAFITPLVSGNMTVLAPNTSAMRLSSAMSLGSTKPGIRFTWLLRLPERLAKASTMLFTMLA